MEELLQKPLERFVCILHHGELPFGHLFAHYDGPAAGPDSFNGPFGKLISEDVWKLPIVEFEKFDNPQLPGVIQSTSYETFKELSKDHQYLLKMLEGVLTGEVDEQ